MFFIFWGCLPFGLGVLKAPLGGVLEPFPRRAVESPASTRVSQSPCQPRRRIVSPGSSILSVQKGANCAFAVALALLSFLNFLFNFYCFLC